MTDKAAEADRASTAFHVALTAIGTETVQDALALWNEMPLQQREAATTTWLANATEMILGKRGIARELAVAYYRLIRALRTGRTVPDPRDPIPTSVSLGELRQEFDRLTGPGRALSGQPQPDPDDDTRPRSQAPDRAREAAQDPSPAFLPDTADSDNDQVLIEELAELEAEAARVETEIELEIQTSLAALGPDNQGKKLAGLDDSLPAADIDKARDDIHGQAGARQAAAAERIAQDGARSTLWTYANVDKRCVGYVRLSRTGTPCGWCAMLISRGPVYRSEASATFADGDLYHDNCHCYALPVFGGEWESGSELYALNRKYATEWPRVTKGLSGKAAVSAWRRFIRQEQQAALAQAARSNP